MTRLLADKDAVRRTFGEISDRVLFDILVLEPSVAELDQAGAAMSGQRDILARLGHPPSARIWAILDIVDSDRGEDD